MRNILSIVALALASGLAAGCAAEKDPGARVWKKKCSACHGRDGAGRTRFAQGRPFADLTDGRWQHGPDRAALRRLVTEGDPKSTMPPFEGTLSPSEIDAVVDHVLKLPGMTPPGGDR